VADEETAGPSGLLLDLAVECMQIGDADRLAVPFSFEKVDLASEWEAPIDLLTAQAKGFLRGQAESIEQAFEKSLERITPRVRRQRADLEKVRFDLHDCLPIDRSGLGTGCRGLWRGTPREAADQPLIARLGIGDGI